MGRAGPGREEQTGAADGGAGVSASVPASNSGRRRGGGQRPCRLPEGQEDQVQGEGSAGTLTEHPGSRRPQSTTSTKAVVENLFPW